MSEEDEAIDGIEREALRECYSDLCERMEPNGLRRRLFSDRLLTVHQNSELQNTTQLPIPDLNERLLDAIRQRSGDDIGAILRGSVCR